MIPSLAIYFKLTSKAMHMRQTHQNTFHLHATAHRLCHQAVKPRRTITHTLAHAIRHDTRWRAGYLETVHLLRKDMLQEEWEQRGRTLALRRGVAEFERQCASDKVRVCASKVAGG